MKPLLVLARITFVGCLWSIIFIEGVRVIVLENWRFDIFWPAHWAYAFNLWAAGWVIDTPKEWAFILILLTFIPLWLTGWIAWSLVPWEKIIYKLVMFPLKFLKGSVEPLKYATSPTPIIQKKKSYKEIRPAGKRTPIYDYNTTQAPVSSASLNVSVSPTSTPAAPAPSYASNPTKDRAAATRETLNHTIFNLDEGDDDFDLGIDSFNKSDIFKIDSDKKKKSTPRDVDDFDEEDYQPEPKPKRRRFEFDEDDDLEEYHPAGKQRSKSKPSSRLKKERQTQSNDDDYETRDTRRRGRVQTEEQDQRNRRERERKDYPQQTNTIVSVLEENGYDVLQNVQIKKTLIDYVAVSRDNVLLCLLDKETGNWLADEERFNDEDPLWFSENSHRISPVRKLDVARRAFETMTEDSDFDFDIKPYLIVTACNIINAEDMLDIWEDIGVTVARMSQGGPAELPVFAKEIEPAGKRLSPRDFDDLRKLFR